MTQTLIDTAANNSQIGGLPIRNTIFIGHANPEDNDFTLWLRSKLINEGYSVECDLTFLIGGENDYWKTIQELLENGTIKYILVYSKNAFLKQGVIDEWEQVKAIAKNNQLADFRLVCKVDDVSFSERIGLNVMNQFRFDNSWSFGLKQLLTKLRNDGVPCGPKNQYSIDDWIKNRFSTEPFLKKKRELYYSNWLEIPELPETIYIHEFDNNTQAKLISAEIKNHPAIIHDKYLINFQEKIPTTNNSIDFDVIPKNLIKIPSISYKDTEDKYEFPGHGDIKKFIVRLLKDAVYKFFLTKAIDFYTMSNNLRCYYYRQGQIVNDKISFRYQNKKKLKQLIGDFFECKWHYGVSVHPIIRPFLRFAIKGHLVFSNDGQKLWDDKKAVQRARKSKGKGFYNEQWRNLMFAFLQSLSNEKGLISIQLNDDFSLNISPIPIIFNSEYGYDEPTSNARIVPLDYDSQIYDEEDDGYEMENLIDDDNQNENESSNDSNSSETALIGI